jgi:UDP-glucuronate decarboxylase
MKSRSQVRDISTVLVAGGAGFVGSHLCDALIKAGYSVLCVDSFLTGRSSNLAGSSASGRFALIEADICNPFPTRGPIHTIFNLACPASPPRYQADPIHTMMTSVVGTQRLLALADRCGARFVQASTSEVYGDPEEHPQREGYWGHVNPVGPRACYDEGKRAAETLCFDYQRLGRVDARVARIFNTYGPRMRRDDGRIVSNFVCQALTGEPITIYGNGTQTRSFCYVSDLVAGLIRLMEHPKPVEHPINLGNPAELTVRELAELVLRLTRSRSSVTHMPLPSDDPRRRQPDISVARRLLGWAPQVPLERGLPPIIDYFEQELSGATGPAAAARK